MRNKKREPHILTFGIVSGGGEEGGGEGDLARFVVITRRDLSFRTAMFLEMRARRGSRVAVEGDGSGGGS